MGTLLIIGLILLIAGIIAHVVGAGGAGGVAIQVGKWVILAALIVIVVLALVNGLGSLD